ncbi:MAG: 1-acyl-sn-glycerol-3-phosphate acyltransferase [Cyclobacteriaceae bacterium]
MFYFIVKWWSRALCLLFFNEFQIVNRKNIPKEGAVIFAPNHQGAFMDAVIVGAHNDKPVSFLTRSDIFKKAAMPFLNALNMRPIYRIRDGYDTISKNDEVFRGCYEMLAENKKRLLIFPEGNHDTNFYLRPLKKGTSRIAFGAREFIDKNLKLYIVPCGVNYFSHRHPAKVILNFGNAIDVDDFMPVYMKNNLDGHQKLKNAIEEGMKSVLILPEKTDDYELRKSFVFQQAHEKYSFNELKEIAKGEIGEIRKPTRNATTRFLVYFFSLLNFPIYLGLKKVLNLMKDRAFYVSLKLYVGSVLTFFWWIILYTIGALTLGWKFGLLLIGASLLFLYARKSLIGYTN